MNCSECEQLFDAYFDGQLSGSLRLEFDAHRLRCRHCQQTLAMLEAVGHILATDADVPELPSDFTDNVMKRIHVRGSIRPAPVRYPFRRIAIVGAALVQAAAVFAIAFFWTRPAARPTPVAPVEAAAGAYAADPAYQGVLTEIKEGIEDKLFAMQGAGQQLTSDVIDLAVYLNVTLPEQYLRDAEKIAGNPMRAIFGPATPSEEPPAEPAAPAEEIHSI